MALLVSTWKHLFLYRSGDWRSLAKGHHSFYGIAKLGPCIYVTARSKARIEPPDVVLRFDRQLAYTARTASCTLGGMHGAGASGSELLVTCADENKVAVYDTGMHDTGSGTWSEWFPFPVRGRDENHVNSVFAGRSGGVVLLAHNRTSPARGSRQSTLHFFDCDRQLQDVVPCGFMGHSIWEEGEDLWIFDSGGSRARKVGGSEEVWVGGFPRGYASDGVHRYVGISQNIDDRFQRPLTDGVIAVYDEHWNQIEVIPVPEGSGPVYELEIISSDDDVAFKGERVT